MNEVWISELKLLTHKPKGKEAALAVSQHQRDAVTTGQSQFLSSSLKAPKTPFSVGIEMYDSATATASR